MEWKRVNFGELHTEIKVRGQKNHGDIKKCYNTVIAIYYTCSDLIMAMKLQNLNLN